MSYYNESGYPNHQNQRNLNDQYNSQTNQTNRSRVSLVRYIFFHFIFLLRFFVTILNFNSDLIVFCNIF